MKYSIGVAALLVTLAAGTGLAQKMNADDLKWINQCIDDNAGEPGATPKIERAYCVCMNEKMESSETRSITQWEKSPREGTAGVRPAGGLDVSTARSALLSGAHGLPLRRSA